MGFLAGEATQGEKPYAVRVTLSHRSRLHEAAAASAVSLKHDGPTGQTWQIGRFSAVNRTFYAVFRNVFFFSNYCGSK